jgi:threonine dehydratase
MQPPPPPNAPQGCNAVICMPVTTPDIKVSAVRALGGTVELVGESYNETQAHAQARAAAEGRVFIAPYDDPYVVAGQGTIAAGEVGVGFRVGGGRAGCHRCG